MKVILTQDVAKIGRRFEVVTVSDGYALNKLIPQRQAEPATPENIKRVEARAQKQADSVAHTADAFQDAIAALKGKAIDVMVETNEEGKMFEALKIQAIISAVKEHASVDIEERWVHVATPVKSVGEHTVLLSLGDVQSEFTINVVSK